jgi:hypothetical protein
VLYAANGGAKEILTPQYLNDQTEALWATLHESAESGILSVAEAAHKIYKVPLDKTLDLLEKRISVDDSSSVQILLRDNGSRFLVSAAYLESLKQRITETFRMQTDAPVEVKTIAKENGWEVSWVMQMVKGDLALPGAFHGETYIPSDFTESKRRAVVEYFATNGCVTSHMCHTIFGILPTRQCNDVFGLGKQCGAQGIDCGSTRRSTGTVGASYRGRSHAGGSSCPRKVK